MTDSTKKTILIAVSILLTAAFFVFTWHFLNTLKAQVHQNAENKSQYFVVNIDSQKVENLKNKTGGTDEGSEDKDSQSASINNPLKKYDPQNPRAVILIANLGINKQITNEAITLDSHIALGFMPYLQNLESIYSSVEKGHEVYIFLPLESSEDSDSEFQNLILSESSSAESAKIIQDLLKNLAKYSGVYACPSEKVSDNFPLISEIIDFCGKQNLGFIVSNPNASSNFELKRKINVLAADIIIDDDSQIAEIDVQSKIDLLVSVAKKNGVAVLYTKGYPAVLDKLQDIAVSLKKSGVELVPPSAILTSTK